MLCWPLLPVPDEDGRLNWPSLESSIRDVMRAVLSTRPGEQLMRPEFGAGLDTLLHEPNTLATRRRIRDRVQSSLARWESRIHLDRVEVSDVDGQPSHVRVHIAYRIVRTGAPGRVGLTLQLEN